MVTDRIASNNQAGGAPNGVADALGLKRSSRVAVSGVGQRGCDPKAREVAMAVYQAVQPQMVIVFGSRARGDYHDDSDIDLMVITGDKRLDNDGYFRATRAAFQKVEDIYTPPVSVDVLNYTGAEFADWRRAKNHVAGQALRDGVDQEGVSLSGRYEDGEPTNWPDIQQRIANAERNLSDLERGVEINLSQEAIGFFAQQTVENALKGWISALDDQYTNTHDIGSLAAIVRRHTEEIDTPAGEQLYWLTKYAVEYRYHGAVLIITDRVELVSIVHDTVVAIIDRIRELSGDE